MADLGSDERATPPRVERKEMVVPTPGRLSALLKAADGNDPVMGTAVALAALTGLGGASWSRCGGPTSTLPPVRSDRPILDRRIRRAAHRAY